MSNFMDREYVERIFTHHPPKSEDTVKAHEKVRSDVLELALGWIEELPDSAEKTLAIRALQKAMMFANSAIAQNS
jgi:hypothetical protein